jgi:long-subunit acyl-CoA synthetase (AMP-forming)
MADKVYRSELTPVSFLRRSAYMFPDKEAVVYGDLRRSYREFETRVNRLASRLRDAGFDKGDRVAFPRDRGLVLGEQMPHRAENDVSQKLLHGAHVVVEARSSQAQHLADSPHHDSAVASFGEEGQRRLAYLLQAAGTTVPLFTIPIQILHPPRRCRARI